MVTRTYTVVCDKCNKETDTLECEHELVKEDEINTIINELKKTLLDEWKDDE